MDEDASSAGQAATTFDVVLRGYHRGQVDAYVQALQERCARSAAALRSAERKLADGGTAGCSPAVLPEPAPNPAQNGASNHAQNAVQHTTHSPAQGTSLNPAQSPSRNPGRQPVQPLGSGRLPEQGPGARMERLIAHAENEAAEIRAGAQRDALAIRTAAQQEAAGLLTEHADRLEELRTIRDRIDAMPGLRTSVAR